jgi:hypothetical protein
MPIKNNGNTSDSKNKSDNHDTAKHKPIGKNDNTESKKIDKDDGADTNSE